MRAFSVRGLTIPHAVRTLAGSRELCFDRAQDVDHAFSDAEYAYLLGLYLGDGGISVHRGIVSMRIHLDVAYPGLNAEVECALRSVSLTGAAGTTRAKDRNCVVVYSYGRFWPCLFPQHGPGKKHLRSIMLEPWQEEIVDRHPGRLLRGLIQSDGWRGLNRVRVNGRDCEYRPARRARRTEGLSRPNRPVAR